MSKSVSALSRRQRGEGRSRGEQTRFWYPFHSQSFNHNSNVMEISFCSHPNSHIAIATNFRTWQDTCAVVECAALCYDMITSNWITDTWNLHRFCVVTKKLLEELGTPCELPLAKIHCCYLVAAIFTQSRSVTINYTYHYNDVIMNAMTLQITGVSIIYSKKISKLHVTGLWQGNSPMTGEFPALRASNVDNFSIWWRHHT